MRGDGLIVVGVDGSGAARAALEFAVEEAARRSGRVRVVTAFQMPEFWPVVCGMSAPTIALPTAAELADDAGRTARHEVADVAQALGPAAQAVPVDVRVVSGIAGKVLVAEAAEADLLVVGHRGLGGFASACLGSVGLQCVLHAPCPVVVVRGRPAPAEPVGVGAAGAARP